MFSSYCNVVIILLLIIGGIISGFTGVIVFPFWLVELFLSVFWFEMVFASLNRAYLDVTKPRTYVWDLKPMIAHVFCYHLIAAYTFSFFILPWLGIADSWRIIIAYPVSYVLIVAVPMQVAVYYYPKWRKKQETERMGADSIRDIALRCEPARRFSERFPDRKIFVYDHAHKNQVATCLLLHRRMRTERTGLMEDIVLSVPVDMEKKQALPGRIESMHYLFQILDGKSSVFHFLEEGSPILKPIAETLDLDTLNRFDSLMNRFPSLEDVPCPVAVRNISYVQIEPLLFTVIFAYVF